MVPDFESLDAEIGRRIAARRQSVRRSQSDVAAVLGKSFQQVQKYEKAANRVSASVLVVIADYLGCAPEEFPPSLCGEAEKAGSPVVSREAMEVMRRFDQLDAAGRAAILAVLDALLPQNEDGRE